MLTMMRLSVLISMFCIDLAAFTSCADWLDGGRIVGLILKLCDGSLLACEDRFAGCSGSDFSDGGSTAYRCAL